MRLPQAGIVPTPRRRPRQGQGAIDLDQQPGTKNQMIKHQYGGAAINMTTTTKIKKINKNQRVRSGEQIGRWSRTIMSIEPQDFVHSAAMSMPRK
jgi:hypothetical protein